MDNRITKTRLSNFLAYKWIAIIATCVAAIFVWVMVYSFASVRLNCGQLYKYYYDYYMVFDTNYLELRDVLKGNSELGYSNGKTYSYDIQEVDIEKLYQESDVLTYRASVQEGDILFTDDSKHKIIGKEANQYLTKMRVDGYNMYIYDQLLEDAKAYLIGFLKPQFFNERGELLNPEANPQYDANNFDLEKIKKCFEDRLSEDNRFRTEEQKQTGVALEKERLEKLCKEIRDFEKIINLPDEYFFTYTKYTQSKEIAISQGYAESVVVENEAKIQKEISEGRQNVRYGLRLDKISELKDTDYGKVDSSRYFSWKETDYQGNLVGEGNDVVALVFNFTEYQPDMQFESIVVINNIVRLISTVLD